MSDHHRLLDAAAWTSAALATVSFWQGVSVAVTIVAALLSIALGLIRVHDRLKYGPRGYRGDA